MHHGVDEQRHAAHDAVTRVRCASLHEARLDEDNLCVEVLRRLNLRHQMVGYDNHAVALHHTHLLTTIFQHTFAVSNKRMPETVPRK